MSKYIVLRGDLVGASNDAQRKEIARLLPEHTIVEQPTREELEEIADSIEVVFGQVPNELLANASSLKWWQLQGAGADSLPPEVAAQGVAVTNASGVHAEPISEHLLANMLAFSRDLPGAFRYQKAHRWHYESPPPVFELAGKRVLLLGTGAIGAAFARKAKALGMKVVGIRRSGGSSSSAEAGEERSPFDRLSGPEAVNRELPHADFLVITLPLTAETRGLIGEHELARMPKSSYVLNIGRGPIIEQNALIAALRDGTISGAGLDVFDPEPLPEDSPLWDMDNVIITTHYAGLTPKYSQRLWSIFLDNLARYVAGEELKNTVDLKKGY